MARPPMCKRCWPPPNTLGETWCFLHLFTNSLHHVFSLTQKKKGSAVSIGQRLDEAMSRTACVTLEENHAAPETSQFILDVLRVGSTRDWSQLVEFHKQARCSGEVRREGGRRLKCACITSVIEAQNCRVCELSISKMHTTFERSLNHIPKRCSPNQ